MASLSTVAASIVGARDREVAVTRADGAVVCERCRVADTPWSRMKGLLGRSELPSDEGILIRPCGSVHTFFMRFPIDVVFLDRDGVVLKIAANVRPWRTAAARRTRMVLELAAGEAERRDLAVGDRLELAGTSRSR